MLCRSLVRLPAVVFPNQALSFGMCEKAVALKPWSLPRALVTEAWKSHDGKLVAFGPGARIGVELNMLYDDALDSLVPTPPNVGHAMGGTRVRLSRTVGRIDSGEQHPLCEVEPLADEELTPMREERLADECELARALIERGTHEARFVLEPSHLDEELGGASVCDPRCHPVWPLQSSEPTCGKELSLWLGSRLPLSTALRVHILSTLCPLRRLQDVVDAMRLLCDPERPGRAGHKFKLIAVTPASDAQCTMSGGALEAPRYVVAEAPPAYTKWTSEDSFPHG